MFQVEEEKNEEKSDSMEKYPFRMLMPQLMNRDNLILQTSPERIGELLEHELRGEVWSDSEQEWIKKRKPMLNDDGVDAIVQLVKTYLTQNSTLSNISEKMAKSQAVEFGSALADTLSINSVKWQLDKSVRSGLVIAITCMVFNVLSRSLGKLMSDKEMYATTISTQEHTLMKMDNQRSGMSGVFSALNPFKKR